MADGFIWYELVTNDMDKAVSFYNKVVGWDVKDAGMPGFTYMFFGKDGKDVGRMMTWACKRLVSPRMSERITMTTPARGRGSKLLHLL